MARVRAKASKTPFESTRPDCIWGVACNESAPLRGRGEGRRAGKRPASGSPRPQTGAGRHNQPEGFSRSGSGPKLQKTTISKDALRRV